LEDNPNGDSARVPLLKAAVEVGDYHLAIATIQPFLPGINWRNSVDLAYQFDNSENTSPDSQEDNSPRLFSKLSVKEKAENDRDIGTAYLKTGSADQALPYLQRAARLEPDPQLKEQMKKTVQQIELAQRRQTTNETRRPEIHSQLEQEHLVRPRLPEPAQPRPQSQKGGAQ